MLKKIVLLIFFFSFLHTFSIAETNDSLISPLVLPEAETSYIQENLTDKVCSLFTTNRFYTFEDIENSIYRSLGDILKKDRVIDVTGYGPYGQPQYATIWGGTSRQFLIYQDGIPFFQQALYVPETGDLDLFTVPLENIETIQIIDNPVANILGRNAGLGGLRIKTKEYKTEKPFSRINFQRGPFGYRRTQLDFGRDLTRKISFYLTGAWKKSDGYITNSNFESLYLTGNLLYKIKENWKIRMKAFHMENRAGNPLPYDSLTVLKTKQDQTILDLSSDYYFKDKSLLELEALYRFSPRESYNGGYFLGRENRESQFALRGSYEFKWKGKTLQRVEGFLNWENVRMNGIRKKPAEGYLSYLGFGRLLWKLDAFVFGRLAFQQGFHWTGTAVEGISYCPKNGLTLFLVGARSQVNPTLQDFDLRRSGYSVHFDSSYFSYQEYYDRYLSFGNLLTLNAGFSWLKQDLKLRSSTFYAYHWDNTEWTLSKMVDWVPPYTYIRYQSIPVNRDRKLFGLNFDLDYIFSPNFEFGFSYAYKRARVDELFVPYVPEHSFFSYFQYSYDSPSNAYGLKVRLEQENFSARYLADLNQDRVPAALVFNSKITLRFLDFRFYYVIENITDERYRTRGDFEMPGRTLWFGFSWDFYD